MASLNRISTKAVIALISLWLTIAIIITCQDFKFTYNKNDRERSFLSSSLSNSIVASSYQYLNAPTSKLATSELPSSESLLFLTEMRTWLQRSGCCHMSSHNPYSFATMSGLAKDAANFKSKLAVAGEASGSSSHKKAKRPKSSMLCILAFYLG